MKHWNKFKRFMLCWLGRHEYTVTHYLAAREGAVSCKHCTFKQTIDVDSGPERELQVDVDYRDHIRLVVTSEGKRVLTIKYDRANAIQLGRNILNKAATLGRFVHQNHGQAPYRKQVVQQ